MSKPSRPTSVNAMKMELLYIGDAIVWLGEVIEGLSQRLPLTDSHAEPVENASKGGGNPL